MNSESVSKRQSLESRFLAQAGEAAPGNLFQEFSDSINATTLRRLRTTAIGAICINLPLFVAFDLHGFERGYAQSQPGFVYLVGWRIAAISISALFLAATSMFWLETASTAARSFRHTARGYMLALALLGAIQSGIAHVLVDDVAIFGLLLCVIASILPTPDRFRWFAYASALLTLGVLAALRKPPEIFYAMMINAVAATAIAILIELIIYRQIEDVFISKKIAEIEREKSEKLLRNVLPDVIASRLRSDPHMIAEGFPEATILFADLVGFTEMSSRISPERLVDLLNDIFGRFDDLAIRHGVEKIKTVGDAYMVACGLPGQNANHLAATADFALAILATLEQVNSERCVDLKLRIGINSGYVVAGIIGHNKFSYDVWGDNVNLASRMESSGLPGRIQVTEGVAMRLRDRYNFEERGSIQVKGKGAQRTFFLVERIPVI